MLIADTRACLDADNYVVQLAGGRPFNLRTFRNGVIIPAVDFYVKQGVNREYFLKNSNFFAHKFHVYYEKRVKNIRSRKNARTVLKWLKDHGIKSVIASNHTQSGVEYQVERLGWKNFIAKIIANKKHDSSFKKRSKEQKIADYLNKYNISATSAMIIGDSPEENEIGERLGLRKKVLIKEGYYASHRLHACGPDELISNLIQIIPICEEMI